MSASSGIPNSEHLVVVGEATAQIQPDLIEITVSLSRVEETMADAKKDIDDRAARVILAARSMGIVTLDITASELACRPHREYQDGEHQLSGYAVDRSISLKLRDLTQFNPLMSKLVSVPVDSVGNISRQLANPAAANQSAMALAIADAKAKAAFLAEQFEVTLGRVYSITMQDKDEERFRLNAASSARDDGTAFEPGTIAVEGRVQVTYCLERPRNQ